MTLVIEWGVQDKKILVVCCSLVAPQQTPRLGNAYSQGCKDKNIDTWETLSKKDTSTAGGSQDKDKLKLEGLRTIY